MMEQIAKNYIKHLQDGDVEQIVRLFAPHGKVVSPLYGEMLAQDFYRELANDTTQSDLTLKGIMTDEVNKRIALYFHYQWTMSHGKVVNFDVVDIIELDADDFIQKLTIIYDTHLTRPYWKQEE